MVWWQDKNNLVQIAEWGHELLVSAPHSRIFALGQSLAWVVKAAEIESRHTGADIKFGYIPFSGKFFGFAHFDERNPEFRPHAPSCMPTRPSVMRYRKTLRSLGVDPKSIIENYKHNGTSTTIVDFAVTGESLASFLSVLTEWADETGDKAALLKALKIHIFTKPGNAFSSVKFSNKSERIVCRSHPRQNTRLMLRLYNADETTRLVPHYNHQCWARDIRSPVPAQQKKTVAAITHNLEKVVGQRVASPQFTWREHATALLRRGARLLGIPDRKPPVPPRSDNQPTLK